MGPEAFGFLYDLLVRRAEAVDDAGGVIENRHTTEVEFLNLLLLLCASVCALTLKLSHGK